MVIVNCALFLFLQVVANLLFKWGGMTPNHYWWGFILGNAVGVCSILFMIAMYRDMPAPIVIAVGTGGTFLLNQVIMFLIYREHLTPLAWTGVFLILTGILMTSLLNGPLPLKKTDAPDKAPQEELKK